MVQQLFHQMGPDPVPSPSNRCMSGRQTTFEKQHSHSQFSLNEIRDSREMGPDPVPNLRRGVKLVGRTDA